MSPERVELVRCQNLRLRFAWLDPYLRTLQALTKYQLGERTFEQVVHRHKEAYFRDQNLIVKSKEILIFRTVNTMSIIINF